MGNLVKRIERLEQQPTPPAANVGEMTEAELLARIPQSVQDLLDKMESDDLHELADALEEGREPNLSPEGAIIAAELVNAWRDDEQPSNTP